MLQAEDPSPGTQDPWQMVSDSSSIFAGNASRIFPEGHPFLAPSEPGTEPSPTVSKPHQSGIGDLGPCLAARGAMQLQHVAG